MDKAIMIHSKHYDGNAGINQVGKCGACGETGEIDDKAKFCQFCGVRVVLERHEEMDSDG